MEVQEHMNETWKYVRINEAQSQSNILEITSVSWWVEIPRTRPAPGTQPASRKNYTFTTVKNMQLY